jgi:hypothetical protein
MVSWRVARLFLAIWLAAFAVQASAVLAFVVPDSCTEEVQGSAADPCPEGCPRCLCCARIAPFVPQAAIGVAVHEVSLEAPRPPLDPSTTPSPHAIYHVPKNS